MSGMNRWQQGLLLIFILLVAAGLRLTGLDWDAYDHHHPDERYITWVATTIERPLDWSTALDPHLSTINPFYWPTSADSEGIVVPQDEARRFAYGHVPLYLGVAATRIVERIAPTLIPILPADWLFTRDVLNAQEAVEFNHLTAVTRFLTALTDTATVLLIFLLGKRLFGTAVGLLSATFLAINVMHIQLAHFFAVDPFLTFFVVGAIYFLTRIKDQRLDPEQGDLSSLKPLIFLLLGAVFIGLAIGSKFSAVMLGLPLVVAVWLGGPKRRRWIWLATAVVTIILTFILTNPFALLDWTCDVITPAVQIGPIDIPALNWHSCYLDNITRQSGMVSGEADMAFTRQYDGTLPYLYPIEMQLRWGMGWLLGIVAFAGFGWFIIRLAKQIAISDQRLKIEGGVVRAYSSLITHHSSLVVLAWVLPFAFVTGGFYVKFMRYLLPLTPFLMVFGAGLLWQIGNKRVRWGATAVTLLFTTLYALAFVNMYQSPHPWVISSEIIFRSAPPRSTILSEQWDDSLPISMVLDGQVRLREEYEALELTWLTYPDEFDTPDELEKNLAKLAYADYVTLVTNRVYGVVPRLPERYPLSSQYHQLLLDGDLGYEIVAVNGRYPNLFGFHIKPDTFGWPGLEPSDQIQQYLDDHAGVNNGRADESFLVYDQPLTIIFRNVDGKTADEMWALFDIK